MKVKRNIEIKLLVEVFGETRERDIVISIYSVRSAEQVDLTRFDAAPSSHLSGPRFECQWAFPCQSGVPSARIVEALMYLKMAISASRRQAHDLCHSNSALIVLKKVSKRRCQSSFQFRSLRPGSHAGAEVYDSRESNIDCRGPYVECSPLADGAMRWPYSEPGWPDRVPSGCSQPNRRHVWNAGRG